MESTSLYVKTIILFFPHQLIVTIILECVLHKYQRGSNCKYNSLQGGTLFYRGHAIQLFEMLHATLTATFDTSGNQKKLLNIYPHITSGTPSERLYHFSHSFCKDSSLEALLIIVLKVLIALRNTIKWNKTSLFIANIVSLVLYL